MDDGDPAEVPSMQEEHPTSGRQHNTRNTFIPLLYWPAGQRPADEPTRRCLVAASARLAVDDSLTTLGWTELGVDTRRAQPAAPLPARESPRPTDTKQ